MRGNGVDDRLRRQREAWDDGIATKDVPPDYVRGERLLPAGWQACRSFGRVTHFKHMETGWKLPGNNRLTAFRIAAAFTAASSARAGDDDSVVELDVSDVGDSTLAVERRLRESAVRLSAREVAVAYV